MFKETPIKIELKQIFKVKGVFEVFNDQFNLIWSQNLTKEKLTEENTIKFLCNIYFQESGDGG